MTCFETGVGGRGSGEDAVRRTREATDRWTLGDTLQHRMKTQWNLQHCVQYQVVLPLLFAFRDASKVYFLYAAFWMNHRGGGRYFEIILTLSIRNIRTEVQSTPWSVPGTLWQDEHDRPSTQFWSTLKLFLSVFFFFWNECLLLLQCKAATIYPPSMFSSFCPSPTSEAEG